MHSDGLKLIEFGKGFRRAKYKKLLTHSGLFIPPAIGLIFYAP